MKVQLTFKHPSILNQLEELKESDRKTVEKILDKCIEEYQQYSIIEIDTVAMTCAVIKQ